MINIKRIFLVMLVFITLAGTASAAIDVAEGVDYFADGGVWTFGNPNVTTTQSDKFITSIISDHYTWVDADGRLAILWSGDHMVIKTTETTSSFYIVFASDSNDGQANVYVDGTLVWTGNTYANVPTGLPISDQKLRSLKITGLDSCTHTIMIENCYGMQTGDNGHVTIYKYGYDEQPGQPETPQEIPEFPTLALPVAAILGLAFFMQRRKEE